MKAQYRNWIGIIAACIAVSGCYSMNDQATIRKSDGKPCYRIGNVENESVAAKPARRQESRDSSMVWYLPIENPSEAVVKVSSYTPQEVMKDMPFDYKVTVENISGYMLDDVVVSDVLAPGIALNNASPQVKISPVDKGGCTGELCPVPAAGQYTKAQWDLGCLPKGESRTITATATVPRSGEFAHCIDVAYIAKMCQQFTVIAPNLKVEKTMPGETLIGSEFPVEITVWNDGSGVLKNVKVVDTLPEGLVEASSNSRSVMFDVDELGVQQPRKYMFQAKALRTGVFTNVVVASSVSGLKDSDDAVIKVIRPLISITKDGPARVSLGREATYRVVVSNKGDAPVSQLVVTDVIPAGSAFVSASDGGVFNEGVITWDLGGLAAGKQRVLNVTVRARQIGTMVNRAQAQAADCPAVNDDATTVVEGVAALLMEVVDSPDPVLIGDTTTYTISIRNQGTTTGRNIVVKAFLEEQQAFVSASGASAPVKQGAATTFAPVEIAPGATAVWKVTARATAAADVRFRSVMTADGFVRPVEETESTTLY